MFGLWLHVSPLSLDELQKNIKYLSEIKVIFFLSLDAIYYANIQRQRTCAIMSIHAHIFFKQTY